MKIIELHLYPKDKSISDYELLDLAERIKDYLYDSLYHTENELEDVTYVIKEI